MVNIETLKDLYDHMHWADAAVWKAISSYPKATEDDKLREYLYHIHLVQHAFLRLWRGESVEDKFPEFSDNDALLQWAKPYYEDVKSHFGNLKEESLNALLNLPWSDMVEKRLGRSPENTTIGETAMQVALHTAHHRGQVSSRLRELGGEPPLIDYIAWLWLGRPEAEWP